MSSQGSRLNKSQQRVTNDESLDMVQRHLRFVANQQRRATPPRCHPISIYILVQAFGCLFTGLTMVITSHWPGTGSRSSNILKIFGPILIGVGGILLLIGILLARFLRKREAKSWDKKISQHILSASRQVLDQSIPTFQGQPTKEHLGTEEERAGLLGSPEGLDTNPKKKTAMYVPSDSETYHSSSSALPQSPLNNEDVPDPVRIKKSRKKNAGSSSSFENLSSLREGDESLLIKERNQEVSSVDEQLDSTTKTTRKTVKTTTTVVTRRVVDGEELPTKATKRPKPPPVPQKSTVTPDSPRLRVKVKASPGTSVNIRHSGGSYEDEASTSQLKGHGEEVHRKPKVQPKPKSKSKSPKEFQGSDI